MKKTLFTHIKGRLKDSGTLAIMLTYILFCLFSLLYFSVLFNARNMLISALYIFFAPLILIAEWLFKIRCGNLFTCGVLFIATGSILGSCFNFYTTLPFLDTILHGVSGALFSALGFSLAERFFGRISGGRATFGAILMAFSFSLAVAVIWELFEYGCTILLGFDMMEDSIVNSINSYLLAGTHNEAVTIDGITKTVIHYGDGLTYIIDGYLDIGLIDTLTDMTVCTAGALLFTLTAVLTGKRYPSFLRLTTPKIDEDSIDNTDKIC